MILKNMSYDISLTTSIYVVEFGVRVDPEPIKIHRDILSPSRAAALGSQVSFSAKELQHVYILTGTVRST